MAHGGNPDEVLYKPNQAKEHRHPRWLILDGKTLAWSHGRDQSPSYKGIILAVKYLKRHRNPIILCVPEWMTKHEDAHHLDALLQDKVLLFTTPSCPNLIEATEISFMDALAKTINALIVTQTGPDTWSEPLASILQFTMTSDSFMLPRDPRGKHGPTLQKMLQSARVPNEYEVKGKVTHV
ncbi:NEDD4-binding protein 1-like [Sardina pilchardus]|uniref:NEDD4-binding protein 1-like n=1 Tax=Sardina pilchardus TaxID=27697 RepID=UPI002E11549C